METLTPEEVEAVASNAVRLLDQLRPAQPAVYQHDLTWYTVQVAAVDQLMAAASDKTDGTSSVPTHLLQALRQAQAGLKRA